MLDGDAAENNLLHAAPTLRVTLLESPHLVHAPALLLGEGYRVTALPLAATAALRRRCGTSTRTRARRGRVGGDTWVMVYYPQATTLNGSTELLPGAWHLRGDSDREHYSKGTFPTLASRWSGGRRPARCCSTKAKPIVVMHPGSQHRALETTDADAAIPTIDRSRGARRPPPSPPPRHQRPARRAALHRRRRPAARLPRAAARGRRHAAARRFGRRVRAARRRAPRAAAAGALWPAGGAPLGQAVAAASGALVVAGCTGQRSTRRGGACRSNGCLHCSRGSRRAARRPSARRRRPSGASALSPTAPPSGGTCGVAPRRHPSAPPTTTARSQRGATPYSTAPRLRAIGDCVRRLAAPAAATTCLA